jgi:hypothetical protein
MKDFRKIRVLLKGRFGFLERSSEQTMTNMTEHEFDQLVRSLTRGPESKEKLHLVATKETLRQRLASLFEPLPNDKLPNSE